MNSVNFDDYSKNYDNLLQSQHKKFGNIDYYNEYKIRILKKLIDSNKQLNILEFGCGIGRNFPFLESTFKNSFIYGYDISQESIKLASKENPNVKFIKDELLDNYSNFFDLIFISGVYHHIPINNRKESTLKIYNLLKKRGKAVIFEHNPYNPLTVKMVNTCVFDEDAILLNKKELTHLFLTNGFKYLKSNYSLFFPPRLKKFDFLEKYLNWIPFGGQYYLMVEK